MKNPTLTIKVEIPRLYDADHLLNSPPSIVAAVEEALNRDRSVELHARVVEVKATR